LSLTLLQRVDFPIYVTLAFLFGIAAQFMVMDGYTFLRRIVGLFERRIGILYAVALVTFLFSPFILNDVVVIILTPVVIRYAKRFSVDVAPLLVAEITFTNIASSLTPLGNPQNILLWSASHVTVVQFVSGTWLPVAASAIIACLMLFPLSRRSRGGREFPSSVGSILPAIYLALVATAIILSDLANVEPYVSLGIGFFLGFFFTFRSIRQVVREFDFRSMLTLYFFIGSVTIISFIVVPYLGQYVLPAAQGEQPYSGLFVGIISNIISNVPATQLVLNTASVSAQVAPRIAVEAGLAGNITPIGSFANILALQMARRAGFPVRRIIVLQFFVGVLSFLPALF
jgi:Na+/H+ antiporter NhaD/arsenite permease-like protein